MKETNQTERVIRWTESMGISRMASSEISPGKIARLAKDVPALKVLADLVKDQAGTDPLKDIRLFTKHGLVLLCLVVVVLVAMVNAMFGRLGTDNEAKMIFACTVIVALIELVVLIIVRRRPAWGKFTRALDTLSGGIFIDLLNFPNLFKIQTHAALLIANAAARRAQAEENHRCNDTLVTRAELASAGDAFLATYDALSIVPGIGLDEHYLNQARDDLKKKK